MTATQQMLTAGWDPCREARAWLDQRQDAQEAWRECPQGDWLIWYAHRTGVPTKQIAAAGVACASLVEHLMPPEGVAALRAAEVCLEDPSEENRRATVRAEWAAARGAEEAAAAAAVAAKAETEIHAKCAAAVREIIEFPGDPR